MIVLRHWGRNHIRLFRRIESYLLGVYQVFDFVFKSPTVIGIMSYTVRVVCTFCIGVIIRIRGIRVFRSLFQVGKCFTPKFALPYFSGHVKNHLQVVQDGSRVGQSNHLLRQSIQNQGFVLHQVPHIQMVSSSPKFPNMLSSSSMSNFKPCRESLVSQLLKKSKNRLCQDKSQL